MFTNVVKTVLLKLYNITHERRDKATFLMKLHSNLMILKLKETAKCHIYPVNFGKPRH